MAPKVALLKAPGKARWDVTRLNQRRRVDQLALKGLLMMKQRPSPVPVIKNRKCALKTRALRFGRISADVA